MLRAVLGLMLAVSSTGGSSRRNAKLGPVSSGGGKLSGYDGKGRGC